MATSLFKKLNLKDQTNIMVLNKPEEFQKELDLLPHTIKIYFERTEKIEFVLIFALTQHDVDQGFLKIRDALQPQAVLWFCYPKMSSKKYKCDFNRDTGWQILGEAGLEPVRMVAIDADWSALRFKRAVDIKTITRRESFALTVDAKSRTQKKGYKR